jgi:hypothetical protein
MVEPRWRGYHLLIVALLLSISLTIAFGPDAASLIWFWRALPIGAAFVLIRRRRAIALGLGVIALGLHAAAGGVTPWLAGALAFGFTGGVILVEIFGHRRVSGQTVSGALCAYLLLGVTFAMLYGAAAGADPEVMRGVSAGRVPDLRYFTDLLYFSFITLATVGYGDIVPVGGPARGLAVLEALLGQLFLVAVVARLVGMQAAAPAEPPPTS